MVALKRFVYIFIIDSLNIDTVVLKFLRKLDLHSSFVDTKYPFADTRVSIQRLFLFQMFLRRIHPTKPGYFVPDNLRAVFQESLKSTWSS